MPYRKNSGSAKISPFNSITEADYGWLLEDFDGDGISNIDDVSPFDSSDAQTFEEVRLSDELRALIAVRKEYEATLKEVISRLKNISGGKGTVKGRVKSPISMINKLRRKRLVGKIETAKEGEQYTVGLTDLAGCMLVLETRAEVEATKDHILSGEVGEIFDSEDYYETPNNGYRAYHFILNLNGHLVEVQLKTRRLSAISAAAHTPYKNGTLNAEFMLRLTDLAVKADDGDTEAAAEIDPLTADESALEQQLSTRQNPSPAKKANDLDELFDTILEPKIELMQENRRNDDDDDDDRLYEPDAELITRQKKLSDLIGLYLSVRDKKFDKAKQSQIEDVLRDLTSMVDLDYDDIVGISEQSPETVTSQTLAGVNVRLDNLPSIKMTKGERRKANDAAVAIINKNDAEITESDREKLLQYTGAGGIGYASSEYQAGRLNEHYTSYDVIKTVWQKLERMGVKTGNFLEPGSGIGNFAGFKPEGINMVMVEKSPISSQIAKLLYPEEEVIFGNYARTDLDTFNLTGAVGNVPFGNYNITPKKDKFSYLSPSIHNYFILKTLDALEPGSPVALITSVATMDQKNAEIRGEMMKIARFVGAYRLPASTFRDNASTEVTTDIIFFQKYHNANDVVMDEDFLNTIPTTVVANDVEYPAQYSAYYDKYPDRILGEMIQGFGQQFLGQMGVKGKFTAAIKKQIVNDADLKLPYSLPPVMPLHTQDGGELLSLPRDYFSGSVVYHNNSFYEKEAKTFQIISIPKANQKRLISALTLLDLYADFVKALSKKEPEAESLRKQFRQQMDSHIDKYGYPEEDGTVKDLLRYDPRLYKLTAFAKLDEKTGETVYADIFEMTEMYQDEYNPTLTDSEDLAEITSYLIAKGSDLSIEDYESVYKGGVAEDGELEKAFAAADNFYLNPATGSYEYSFYYLAGDIRKKIHEAQEAGLEENVEALQKVAPEYLSVYDFDFNPGDVLSWLPDHVIEKYVNAKLGSSWSHYSSSPVEFRNDYVPELQNKKLVEFKTYAAHKEADRNKGFGDVAFTRILKAYIEGGKFPLVYRDSAGNVVPKTRASDEMVKEAEKEQILNTAKMHREIKADFENWLRIDAKDEIRQEVADRYNEMFNSYSAPQFDGTTFRVSGMSNTFYGIKDFTVFKHNLMVAEKLAWNKRGGNCHDVGAGKTLATIILNEHLRQRGLVKKPVFVVPGKVIEKWQEEYLMLFPDAKVLNLRLAGQKKDKELLLAQLYDWDAIFVPMHAFSRIPLSPEVRIEAINARIEQFRDYANDIVSDNDSETRLQKELERKIETFEKQVEDINDNKRETDVYFDQMGIDGIYVDEAHFYKNAIGSPEAYRLGIAANNPSQRAEDMLQKCDWLRRKIGERNIYVLTATPVVNSPIEIFHMLKLCAPSVLDDRSVGSLDMFIRSFVTTESTIQKDAAGRYVERTVISGYQNIPEMQRIINEVIDVKSYDQLQKFYVDNPVQVIREDGSIKNVQPFKRPTHTVGSKMVEPSRIHKLFFEDIMHRADDIIDLLQKGEIPKDNFLVLTTDGSNIATDLRLHDEAFQDFTDHESLKINQVADEVWKEYQRQGMKTGNEAGAAIQPEAEDAEIISETKTAALNTGESDPISVRKNPKNELYQYRENGLDVSDDIYGDFFTKSTYRNNPVDEIYRCQIIFASKVNMKDGSGFHEAIKDKLVDKGIPFEQIAIINGSTVGVRKSKGKWINQRVGASQDKEELKQEAAADYNKGKYRVIIGNQTIAEGMNLNKFTTAIHHFDVPYTPAEIQQRNGRGVRQGNTHKHVDVLHYLMRDSFDQYRLQLVLKKQNWINELFYGGDRTAKAETNEELGYEQMMAATASDPRVVEYMEAMYRSNNIKPELDQSERIVTQRMAEMRNKERHYAEMQQDTEKEIEGLEKQLAEPMPEKDHFKLSLDLVATTRTETTTQQFEMVFRYKKGQENVSETIPAKLVLRKTSTAENTGFLTLEKTLHTPIKEASARIQKYKYGFTLSNLDQFSNSYKNYLNPAGHDETFAEIAENYAAGTMSAGKNIVAFADEYYEHYKKELGLKSYKDMHHVAGKYAKERGQPSENIHIWNMDKTNILDAHSWKPLLEETFHHYFYTKTKTAYDDIPATINRFKARLIRTKNELNALAGSVHTEQERYESLKLEADAKQRILTENREVINSLTETEFPSRGALYAELNNITFPAFGLDTEIEPRLVGIAPPRKNPSGSGVLAYLGRVHRLETSNHMLEGDDYMFTDADGTTLYIVPNHRVKETRNAPADANAEAMHETFKRYAADGKDYEITAPDTAEVSAGTAEKIWYTSDKIMQEGDRKGKENHYVHDFDPGKRTVSIIDDVIIIQKLEINHRGILN